MVHQEKSYGPTGLIVSPVICQRDNSVTNFYISTEMVQVSKNLSDFIDEFTVCNEELNSMIRKGLEDGTLTEAWAKSFEASCVESTHWGLNQEIQLWLKDVTKLEQVLPAFREWDVLVEVK